jgi:hypothetical protein
MRRTAAFVLAIAILETLVAGFALAQTGTVLGVVPEGAVIDAAQFPDLRPGAKVGFHRSDGSVTEVAQGSVADVRDGRALIKLKPGGAVQAGDVAVPCAALSGPGSQADLRTSFQALKAQLATAGGGAPEVQAVVAQIESALDARETTIRDGACDVTAHDQQIAVLTTQVQQVLAPAPPLPGSSPSPAAPAAVRGVPPSSSSSGVAAPSQQGAAQDATQQDPMDKAMDLVKRLFQMAQSKGPKRGGGGSSAPSSPALAPADPGAGAPNPPSPGASAPGPSAGPPAGGGSPGAPPGTGPAPGVSVPPSLGGSQPPAGGSPSNPPPGGVAAPPPAGSSGPPGQPPAWWTIPKLKPPPPRIVGAPPGAVSGALGSATAPALTPSPGATPLPEVAHLRIVTIHGGVQTEKGSPIQNALVTIAGRHVSTGPNGEFRLFEVPAGRHTLVVTAAGYRGRNVTLDLSSGEPGKVTLTLQPHTVSPPASPQRPGVQRRIGVQQQFP